MEIRAEILSKILLMQNMLAKLPSRETIFSFVCRGIEDMPGVERAEYSLGSVPPTPGNRTSTLFPVYMQAEPVGFITAILNAPELFKPYSVYINNICYMMAALFRERDQQRIDEERQAELERTVTERTARLSELMDLEAEARRRAERYLQVAEAIIVDLDPDGIVRVINKRGVELLGRPAEAVIGRDWFELAIPEEDHPRMRALFSELLATSAPERSYNENRIRTADGSLRYIAWNSEIVRDDAGLITGILSSGQDITDRRAAEERMRHALHANEILLQELYHRTRNNMQVISGLLTLQAAKLTDPRLTAVLQDVDNRIHSIALIHQRLYETRDLSNLRLDEYVEELAGLLVHNYRVSEGRIRLDLELEPIEVDIETALPFGLLVNELLSNCLKHAFPDGRDGTVNVVLSSAGGAGIELIVADDGAGLPEEIDIFGGSGSLGGYLIKSITEYQLSGTVEMTQTNGTRFRIMIPAPSPRSGIGAESRRIRN